MPLSARRIEYNQRAKLVQVMKNLLCLLLLPLCFATDSTERERQLYINAVHYLKQELANKKSELRGLWKKGNDRGTRLVDFEISETISFQRAASFQEVVPGLMPGEFETYQVDFFEQFTESNGLTLSFSRVIDQKYLLAEFGPTRYKDATVRFGLLTELLFEFDENGNVTELHHVTFICN